MKARSMILAASMLGGCSTMTEDRGFGAISVADVINKARCELAEALKLPANASYRNQNWLVVMSLTLKKTAVESLGASVTARDSLSRPGDEFSAVVPFGFGETTKRAFNQNYALNLRAANDAGCAEANKRLAGGLNLAAFLAEDANAAATLTGVDGLKRVVQAANSKAEFSGTVEFTIDRNISPIGVTWTLRHFVGPGNILSVSDSRVNTLDVAFVPLPPPPALAEAGTRPRHGTTPARITKPAPTADAVKDGLNAIKNLQEMRLSPF